MSLPALPRDKGMWMYTATSYGGVRITENALAWNSGCQNYFQTHEINWQFLQQSTTTKIDPVLGEIRFWDVVVENQKVLKDAAWLYVAPPEGCGIPKDMMTFRAYKSGDAGFGLKRTGEADGVDIDESWFG